MLQKGVCVRCFELRECFPYFYNLNLKYNSILYDPAFKTLENNCRIHNFEMYLFVCLLGFNVALTSEVISFVAVVL